jgi:hypothetical protein
MKDQLSQSMAPDPPSTESTPLAHESAGDPRFYHRWCFWLLVALLSAFFAEVTSGNEPWVFFREITWRVTVPVYGLHTLVLAALIWWRRRPNFACLFLAGALFGLYEAYMTKVLWTGWTPDDVEKVSKLGGVAVVETLVLVLFWHPWLAFIIPLAAAERLCCRSADVAAAFGRRTRSVLSRRGAPAAAGLVLGVFGGAHPNIASTWHALGSAAGSTLLVLAALSIWLFALRGDRYRIRQLLPKPWEWLLLAAGLAGMYWYLTVVFGPDRIPDWGPQATVWGMYVVLIGLLARAMALRPEADAADGLEPMRPNRWQTALAFAACYTLSATTVAAAIPMRYRMAIFLALILGGILFGLVVFLAMTSQIIWRRR